VNRVDAAFMRGWMIANGLDPVGDRDPKSENMSRNMSSEAKPAQPDRRRIAEILADKAAPWELDWLAASCPSERAALEYRPARIAWCIACAGPTINDEHGCQGCRA